MLKRNRLKATLWLLLFFVINSCKPVQSDRAIRNVHIDTHLFRFDELVNQQTPITKEDWGNTLSEHKEFIDFFSRSILATSADSGYLAIEAFQQYFDSIGLNEKIEKKFIEFPEFDQFVKVQKRLTLLVPQYQSVNVTTMNSGFNYKNALLPTQVAVGLDLYLGEQIDYLLLNNLVFDYQLHQFSRAYIVPDMTTAVVDDLYPDSGDYNTLIKQILFQGKKLALKQAVQPKTPAHIILGMTEKNYQWCLDNEFEIWQYFITQELLYNNDIHRWKTYVFPGPFSAGMPEDAPAMTGSFIGWQIIKAYLKTHPKISYVELFNNQDAVSLLKDSGYRP